MARKKFNSTLAIKLRNEMGLTQKEFADQLAEETSKSEELPSISIRTIRELENGTSIDEQKGLFIFSKLGQEPSEEVYEDGETPPILPLTRADYRGSHILSEVSLGHGKGIPSLFQEVDHATHYYLHLGDLNADQWEIVLPFADLVTRRGKIKTTSTKNNQDLLNQRLADAQLLRQAREKGVIVFTSVIEDKFTLFASTQEEMFNQIVDATVVSDELKKTENLRDHLKIQISGPRFIAMIGITSLEDKSIRIAKDNNDNDLQKVLLIDERFTIDEVFEFGEPSLHTIRQEKEENFEASMVLPIDEFKQRFPNELENYGGPFFQRPDEPTPQYELLLWNRKVIDKSCREYVHRQVVMDTGYTKEEHEIDLAIEKGINEQEREFYLKHNSRR